MYKVIREVVFKSVCSVEQRAMVITDGLNSRFAKRKRTKEFLKKVAKDNDNKSF